MAFTRSDYTLNANFTQTSLKDAIKTAFNAMPNHVLVQDTTSSTDLLLIYLVTLNASKVCGKSYLKIRVTNTFSVRQQLLATWDIATKTGTLASTESSAITFINTSPIQLISLVKNPEYHFLALSQNSTFLLAGCLYPENRPSWWNEDAHYYIFHNDGSTTNIFKNWYTVIQSPFNISPGIYTTDWGDLRLSNVNPETNKRAAISGMSFYSSSQGDAGRTSNELISVAALGQTRFEQIVVTPGVEEYLLIIPNSGAMTLRSI
ncbi:hypothetical protein [uncultured Nostoc sp.]|uniref:hypothetical protein n=1 Tax=uncultured Nostoc sp. TaxID=340711 RepID=UPI0035CB7847